MNHSKIMSGLLMVALFALCASAAFSQAAPAEATTQPGGDVDRKRFDSLRGEGFEALYSLDYEGARRRFKELARLFPDHPAGPQFLAATIWLQTLNESRRLQASLYSTEGFYANTKDKVDPQTVAQFRELTRQAKQLAEARLKLNRRDTEALYYLGATEGLKAACEGAVERSFMSALRNGSDSVDRHREVIKLEPAFHDAEITIGMYDYIVGSLPLPVKLLATIGGIRGSKKRGLATLERVAREGQWARDDAKVLLIALFKREKRYTEALVLARELAAKYPRNYLFKLEAADALVSQAAVERTTNPTAAASSEREAFTLFETLLRDRTTAREATAARLLDLIHFRYGEALFVAGQFDRAAKEYVEATLVTSAEPGLVTLSRLRAAQSLDLAGKRTEALVHYKAVLARPDVYDSHAEAKRGLREPYRKSGANNTTGETNTAGEESGTGNDE